MSREVKMNRRSTRDGTFYGVSLYDDLGRWILTSRVDTLDAYTAEQIAKFLDSGYLTGLAQRAISTRKS